jgi:hypothetical protein
VCVPNYERQACGFGREHMMQIAACVRYNCVILSMVAKRISKPSSFV